MRKLQVLLMSMIFFVLACPPVDATITWDGAYSVFRYSVENGGQFYYKRTNDYKPAVYASDEEITNYGDSASATLSELGGAISLTSMAKGGSSLSNGLQVQGYAQIVRGSLTIDHGVGVSQDVVSYVTRRFQVTADPWRPYNVKANLTGVVDFNDFSYGPSYLGTHSVQGTVELYESLDDFNQDFRTVHSWTVNESVKTINTNVFLRTDANARYELKIVLTLESKLVNMVLSSGSIDILGVVPSGNYNIGSGSLPLTLKAEIIDLKEPPMDDGVPPANDNCPSLYNPLQEDSDRDSVGDVCDNCPSVSNSNQLDSDGDHVGNACDGCPDDPLKIAPGVCGCFVSDFDSDRDGTPDCNDLCPNDPAKVAPGVCGCSVSEFDFDQDGTPDCNDLCPNNAIKTAPGVCGCSVPDTDSDLDGIPNCIDQCPNDPAKIAPGICGCGTPDRDSDSDGTLDCNDLCPDNPGKTEPGICGCGRPDKDTNGDGIVDCPNNLAPGPGVLLLLLDE